MSQEQELKPEDICPVCCPGPSKHPIQPDETHIGFDAMDTPGITEQALIEAFAAVKQQCSDFQFCVHDQGLPSENYFRVTARFPEASKAKIAQVASKHPVTLAVGEVVMMFADFLLEEGVFHPSRCEDVTHQEF